MRDDARAAISSLRRLARSHRRRGAAAVEGEARWPPGAGLLLATLLAGVLWAAIIAGLRQLVV